MDKKIGFEQNYAQNRMILKDVLPLDIPICISFEPTNICNFRCVMCCHGSEEYTKTLGQQKNIEWELFDKCISQIEEWSKKTNKKVKLMKLYSLGEPLINEQTCDMVKRIKEADICQALEITSNASLLTEEIARKLVDYGLDIFRVSVYSVDDEHNRQLTKSNILPQVIADNVKRMYDYRESQNKKTPFISAKMMDSYSDENERFIKKYENIADEAYIDKITIFDENIWENYYGDKQELAKADPNRLKLAPKRKVCRYPFTHLTVRSDGKVVVCCADWVQATVVGDVNEKSLPEIWTSKKLYDFRCMMLKTKGADVDWCRDCEIPLRDLKEDDIDDFPMEKLSYTE